MHQFSRRFGASKYYAIHPGSCGLAVHPQDGRILAASGCDVRLLSADGDLLIRYPFETYSRVAFTPDGRRFVAGIQEFKRWNEDYNLPEYWFKAAVCDLQGTEPPVTILDDFEADVSGCQFSTDGKWLLLWSANDGNVYLVDWPTSMLKARYHARWGARFVRLSPNNRRLLCCFTDHWELLEIGPDGTFPVLDRSQPVPLPEGKTWSDFAYSAKPGAPMVATFLGDSENFAVGYEDGTIEIVTPTAKERFQDHKGYVEDLLSCEAGDLLLSCDDKGLICARETKTGEVVARYRREWDNFEGLASSPDGKVLCRGRRETFVLEGPRTLKCVSPEQPMFRLSHGCFSPANGRTVLTSSDGRVRLIEDADIESREIYFEQPRKRESLTEAFFLDVEAFFLRNADEIVVRGLGDQYDLTVLGTDGRLRRHLRLIEPMRQTPGEVPQRLHGFAIHPKDDLAVGGYMDGVVRWIDLHTETRGEWDTGLEKGISELVFSAEGDFIAISGIWHGPMFGPRVKVYDWPRRHLVREFDPVRHPVKVAALAPGGRYLAAIGGEVPPDEVQLHVWDVRCGAHLWERSVHQEQDPKELSLTALAFSHDGNQLAVGTYWGQVTLHRTKTGERIRTLDCHIGRITSLIYSPDDKLIATSSHDGTAAIWKTDG